MPDDSTGWSISCDGAQANAQGHVYVLEVLSDGENFASNVRLVEDIDAESDRIIYEVDEWLTALCLSDTGVLYLGDASGKIHSNESGTWKIEETGCDGAVTEIKSVADGGIYLTGGNGFVARRQGQAWERFGPNTTETLYSIDGCSARDLYVVGEKGRAYHWNGQAWQALETATNLALHAVLALSPESVYICGAKGIVLHGHHDQWRFLDGWDEDLYALAHYNGTVYLGAGGLGLLCLEGSNPTMLKDNIYAYGLIASGGYLCVSGDNEIVRYDGHEWAARGYEL